MEFDGVLLFCVLALTASVVALVTFLRRLGRGEIRLTVRDAPAPHVQFPRDAKNVVLSRNPWQVLTGRSFENEVEVSITSQVAFTAICFWGISGQKINNVLQNPASDGPRDQRQVLQRALSVDCHQQDTVLIDASPGSRSVKLTVPKPLLAADQSSFILLLTASSHSAVNSPTDVVALAAEVLYSPYPQPTANIQSQWVVSREGRACQLQLFSLGIQTESGAENPKCVVCHTAEVQHALLPCRHLVLCDSCSLRVGTCPVCRTPIESHFSLGSQTV